MKRVLISGDNLGCKFQLRRGMFRREDFWALRDVSFCLREGDSLAIIGRNGAGKSTLLQIMAGIIPQTKGHLQRDTRSVALLQLNAGLQPNLSGRLNAMLGGVLLGMQRKYVASRLDAIQELSELGAFFEEPVTTYSSGMRARLGFATAYQLNAEVMLLDELLGVGDAAFRQKSERLMHERLQSSGTAVLVSHNANLVASVCNQALWIEEGVTQQFGPVDEVLDAYHAGTVN